MPIPNSILIVLYVFQILVGVYQLVEHGISILRLVIMALSLVTVLALAGKGGELARRTALVYAGLMLVLGLVAVGMSIWSALTSDRFFGLGLIAGAIILPVSAFTIFVLKKNVSTAPT